MTTHLPTLGLLTVVLAFVGAGIALTAGIGLVAVYARLGDGVPTSTTRNAFGLWAVGALLLAVGTPGVVRATLAGTSTVVTLAVAAVVVGLLAVGAAPVYLWQATLDPE